MHQIGLALSHLSPPHINVSFDFNRGKTLKSFVRFSLIFVIALAIVIIVYGGALVVMESDLLGQSVEGGRGRLRGLAILFVVGNRFIEFIAFIGLMLFALGQLRVLSNPKQAVYRPNLKKWLYVCALWVPLKGVFTVRQILDSGFFDNGLQELDYRTLFIASTYMLNSAMFAVLCLWAGYTLSQQRQPETQNSQTVR